MQELIPLGFGLLLGSLLGGLSPRMRWPVAIALSVVLGVTATIVTGEFELGWEYVLFDIPLVALATALGFFAARRAHGTGKARTG
jgi:hypothetical protein